jgi:flagellar protein FlbB
MKSMQNHREEIETKKQGFFKWLLYVIFIPALFAAILFAIVFNALGYDVIGSIKDMSKHIPFISSTEETVAKGTKSTSDASKLEAKTQKQEEEISKLKKDLEQKQADIRSLEIQLRRETSSVASAEEAEGEALAKMNRLVKKVTQSYEEMKPKQAAKIVQELPKEDAIELLSRVKPDVLAAILENLDPKLAATYTSSLSNTQPS